MPRKGKRSQAQSLHWSKEMNRTASPEQAECVGPQSSGEVQMSAESRPQSVKQGRKHDASCVPELSYATTVKRGCHSDETCVAGPSNVYSVKVKGQSVSHAVVAGPSHANSVNLADQPSELNACASRSQASSKYGKNRNQQCTCNSFTFVAFLYENENLTTADLNHVLDKGNVMYNEARQRVTNHIYLTIDELPTEVPACNHTRLGQGYVTQIWFIWTASTWICR